MVQDRLQDRLEGPDLLIYIIISLSELEGISSISSKPRTKNMYGNEGHGAKRSGRLRNTEISWTVQG